MHPPKLTHSLLPAFVLMIGACLLVAAAGRGPLAVGQEEADEATAVQLEKRLNDIERELEKAQADGNETKVRELRREAQQVLDRLEAIERARREPEGEEREGEGDEEFEVRARELELHQRELEVERLHHELARGRQEDAVRLAQIASERLTSISYAITQAVDQLGEEGAVDFLMEMRQKNPEPVVKRLIAHHLATQLQHLDRPEEARDVLRELILEK